MFFSWLIFIFQWRNCRVTLSSASYKNAFTILSHVWFSNKQAWTDRIFMTSYDFSQNVKMTMIMSRLVHLMPHMETMWHLSCTIGARSILPPAALTMFACRRLRLCRASREWRDGGTTPPHHHALRADYRGLHPRAWSCHRYAVQMLISYFPWVTCALRTSPTAGVLSPLRGFVAPWRAPFWVASSTGCAPYVADPWLWMVTPCGRFAAAM